MLTHKHVRCFQHMLPSAQPPSPRKPLPAIASLTLCVFTLTCCMRVCRVLHFSRFLPPQSLGQTDFFSQNSPAILLSYHWYLKHWFLARFTPTFEVRMCAPHALLSHGSHSRHLGGPCALPFRRDPLPRSLICVTETDVLQPQTMCKSSSHTFGIVEPSLNPASLAVVLEWCPYIQSESVLSVLLQMHPSSFLYIPNNYAFSSRSLLPLSCTSASITGENRPPSSCNRSDRKRVPLHLAACYDDKQACA